MRRRVVLAVLLTVLASASVATAQDGTSLRVEEDHVRAPIGERATWTVVVENDGNASRTVELRSAGAVRLPGACADRLGAQAVRVGDERFEPKQRTIEPNSSASFRYSLPVPDEPPYMVCAEQTFSTRIGIGAPDGPTVAAQNVTFVADPPDVPVRLLPSHLFAVVGLAVIAGGLAWGYLKEQSPTLVLAATMLGLFFVQLIAEPNAIAGAIDPAMQELSLRPRVFLQGGQWWAPVSHMFMHGGLLHILGNMIMLVLVGPRLEDYMSERDYTVLYFLSGLGAAGATLLLLASDPSMYLVPNVGASGAISGIMAAFAMRLPRERIPLPIGIMIFIPAYIAFPIYIGYNIFLAFGSTNIAWWAHLAGAAVGAVFAYFWKPEKPDAYTWGTVEVPEADGPW